MPVDVPDISVITRFHDIKGLRQLDEMLFSLVGQDGVSLKSLILGQSIDEKALAQIDSLCGRYKKLGLDVRFFNQKFVGGELDRRSELLNRGLALIDTQYVAFLDFDDVVYPSCYSRLIRRLKATNCAIAFAGVVRADRFTTGGGPYTVSKSRMYAGLPKARFFIDNQYPIHSYVVDMSSIDRKDLYFDDGVCRNEDYGFLYRILAKYRYDDEECAREGCEYRVDMGGSNTIGAYRSDKQTLQSWAVGGDYMSVIKQANRITLDHRDLCDLASHGYETGKAEVARAGLADRSGGEGDIDAKRVRFNLSAALSATLTKSIDAPGNGVLMCHVEQRTLLEQGCMQLSGWCSVGSETPAAALFCTDQDGEGTLVVEFAHRADVAEHLASQDHHFGFSVCVATRESIKLVAISRDGQIYQAEVNFDGS